MNTIILSSTEHLKDLAIASATLEDKTIFIVHDDGPKIGLTLQHMRMEAVKIQPTIFAPRISSGQPWKKPWKR